MGDRGRKRIGEGEGESREGELHMRGSPKKRLLVYILEVFLGAIGYQWVSGLLSVISRSSRPILPRRKKLDLKTLFFKDFSLILVLEPLTIAFNLSGQVKGDHQGLRH